jgi:hypothetical protein
VTTARKEVLAALSLANLCFLGVWAELFGGTRRLVRLRPFASADYLAVILDTLLLAAAFWGAAWVARRLHSAYGGRLVRALFVITLLVPLNTVRAKLALAADPVRLGQLAHQKIWVAPFLGLLIIAGLWTILRPRTAFRLVRAGVVLLFPFFLLTTGRALWRAGSAAGSPWRPPQVAGPLPKPTKGRRVVWLLFDELDENIAFSQRSPSLQLPELDRLRSVSWHATNAVAVAHMTLTAIPSLMTGVVMPPDTDRFLPTPGVGMVTVFEKVRAQGLDTHVVGWAYPYCRVFRNALSSCEWEPIFLLNLARTADISILGSMRDAASTLSPWNSRRVAIRTYEALLHKAETLVAREEPGLVYIHLSVPHAPVIYDRFQQRTATGVLSGREGYLHNVALVDRTVGDLRRHMEEAGTWDATTVFVSADHPWRDAHLYEGHSHEAVPFLLKLANHAEAIEHRGRFSALLTGDLMVAVLSGEVASPDQVAPWLARHAAS